MTEPRSLFLDVEGYEIHVTEWGPTNGPVLVMWHGLARTGRDFDSLARHFRSAYRIVCPDTIGRGLSSWSRQPDADYVIPRYGELAERLLDRLGIGDCHWIGTSMGGLIGMTVAAGAAGGRIGRLVVNDIGPRINPAALARIRSYVTQLPAFATLRELEALLRQVYRPFGRLSDAEWRAMAETSARRRDDGQWTLHYDPAVMRVFAAQPDDGHLWAEWDRISCPTLVLRGVAEEMTRRGPRALLVTVPGCGHAPALNVSDQIAVIEAFLEG